MRLLFFGSIFLIALLYLQSVSNQTLLMTSSSFSAAEPNKVNAAKKPKLLVVDDEQDNLDLLYRTFRKEFTVFRADGGIKALEILEQEGEMAAIISDQRMPEMNGTEFLSRTVSDFPDTIRIVLTGYTDINDLIDAINSGQVHKYITKPWEPDRLKLVVSEATHSYGLLKQRSEELVRSQTQNALLSAIVEITQKSNQVSDCLLPLASAFWQNFVTMQNFKSSFEPNFEMLLALAIAIAYQAHAGQLDKAGKPYISHPLTVMAQMDTLESKIVAVLHDAIEDSDFAIADLVHQGFPEFITDAIAAITKLDGELYEDYILRVKSNAIARQVKIADVTHNMDISRIANPTEKDFQRLEKYKKILQELIS